MRTYLSAAITSIFIIIIFSTLLPTVAAHGYVAQVTIDGKLYIGNLPNASPSPSMVRQIDDVEPVKGTSNSNLNCGQAAQKAALVAPANPGSKLTFSWKGGDGSNWPHNIGPIVTYMAACVNTTCDQYDSTHAEWFKIGEDGMEQGNVTWCQQNLMNGSPANVTIPATLAPGQYLIRHEIIALHLATQLGGAEFYPSCTQVQVGGSQSGGPRKGETVTFPGGYSDNDPGINDPTVFDTPLNNYVFPGPAIAQFVLASSSNSSSPSPSSSPSQKPQPTTTSSAPPSSSSASGSGGSASCKLRTQNMYAQHRSVSRIMRDLVF